MPNPSLEPEYVDNVEIGVAKHFGSYLKFNLSAYYSVLGNAMARLSWQRGFEELDNGDTSPSRHVAPLFGRAAVGYDNGRLTIETFVQFQAECRAENMPEEEKDKKEIYALDAAGNAYSPAWATINMSVGYKALPNLCFNATLENVADLRYRPYSCGISAPGRNFTVSMTYDF